MRIYLFALMLVISCACSSQDAPVHFGKVTPEDFKVNTALVDSATSAVIIADVGNTSFTGNDKGWFSYLFKHRKRILIRDKKAFELATIEIPLYKGDKDAEKLVEITASTYNLENGQVKEVKLDKKSLLLEKQDRNHLVQKFAFPSVVEGSIIEYSYTVRSDFEFNLPAWKFQDYEHPTLWSEYNVIIPSLLSYRTHWQGYNGFFIDKGDQGKESYVIKKKIQVGSIGLAEAENTMAVSTATIKHRWVMKDLAPVGHEDYLTTPENFIAKINFQLYEVYDGEEMHAVANSWRKLTEELMTRDDFGKPLEERESWMSEAVKPLIAQKTDKLQ